MERRDEGREREEKREIDGVEAMKMPLITRKIEINQIKYLR